jgi:hypothetical protein
MSPGVAEVSAEAVALALPEHNRQTVIRGIGDIRGYTDTTEVLIRTTSVDALGLVADAWDRRVGIQVGIEMDAVGTQILKLESSVSP